MDIQLKEFINNDAVRSCDLTFKERFLDWLFKSEQYYIRTYIMYLRKEEYYSYVRCNKWMRRWYKRKRNMLGVKLGFFISPGCFGKGLRIWHYGSVIVHPGSKIGRNCQIHGNCCIGNRGGKVDSFPMIGDNVDIGQGAQILGDVTIADGVKIGAGAIVVNSVLEENATVVGIPARIIKK